MVQVAASNVSFSTSWVVVVVVVRSSHLVSLAHEPKAPFVLPPLLAHPNIHGMPTGSLPVLDPYVVIIGVSLLAKRVLKEINGE